MSRHFLFTQLLQTKTCKSSPPLTDLRGMHKKFMMKNLTQITMIDIEAKRASSSLRQSTVFCTQSRQIRSSPVQLMY